MIIRALIFSEDGEEIMDIFETPDKNHFRADGCMIKETSTMFKEILKRINGDEIVRLVVVKS